MDNEKCLTKWKKPTLTIISSAETRESVLRTQSGPAPFSDGGSDDSFRQLD